MAQGCLTVHQHKETCGNGQGSAQKSNLATSFPYVTTLCYTDDLNDLGVNTAMWCIFMSVTLQAAVHLGRDFLSKHTINQESIFDVCGAIISET